MYNSRTWAEIDLNNIKHNFSEIRNYVGNTKIMSVVKADAYGHGAVKVAKTLESAGTDYFAVACVDEALELRNNGIKKPILVLSYIPKLRIKEALKNNIAFTVYTYDLAEDISKTAKEMKVTATIHIKIDTGMGRIGFLYGYGEESDKNTISDIKKISELDNLNLEGIFTHFSSSDEADNTKTEIQINRFNKILNELNLNKITFTYRHCCNSAALIRFKNLHMDMVRPGIILYGSYPSPLCNNGKLDLKPAMSLKTSVVNIKTIDKDFGISYGEIYKTDKKCKIATIPIGYADGFSRLNGNTLNVSVNEILCKIVGRICMDQCMIDVTNVNNIDIGSVVTVFGFDGLNYISVENVADICNTINYEILCNVGKRVPRTYL